MRTRIACALVGALLISMAVVSTTASAQKRIAVSGTETVVEASENSARVSRDAGATWQSLARPDNRIMLRYGAFDPLMSVPSVAAVLRAAPDNQLYVVQYHTTSLEEYRQGLRDLGAEIHQFIAWQAAIVRMSPATANRVAQLPYVRWVGEMHLAFKLEEELIAASLSVAPMPTRRYNIMPVDWNGGDHAYLLDGIRAAGGKIENIPEGSIIIEATLTKAQLLEVAALNTVLWIDRWTPIEFDVDLARIQGGANYLEPMSTLKYTGKGIRGYNTEAIETSHPEFGATAYRSAPLRHRSTSSSGHGTNVNGIIFAKGNSPIYRGLCPDAQCIAASSGVVGGSRDAVTREAVDPNLQWKAMMMTASWGNARTTLYTSVAAQMDDVLFKYDIPHTQSQSNAGATPSRPQAWAKNMISVGGFRHYNTLATNDDCWCRSGSIGPAVDGRIKPDISAYYDSIRTTSTGGGYSTSFGGTSGATPTVNGHVGLILEMYTDGLFGNALPQPATWQNRFANQPHMTTTKALLINTARQYTFSGTTHDMTRVHQGYGFPSVQDLYDLRDRILVINEDVVLTNGTQTAYLVFVPSGYGPFRVTLDYADPAGAANSTINRINDLDLKVTAPNGTVYWGNNGLNSANYSSAGGVANTVDTVENVFVQNPAKGAWTVEVIAKSVVRDGHVETPAVDADFALVTSGIRSGRDTSGPTIALTSTSSTDLKVALGNQPASYATGYVLYSLSTVQPAGLGTLFGLQPDLLTSVILTIPASAGSPFHFVKTGGSVFPNVPYQFGAAVATALKGIPVDAVAAYLDAGAKIVDVTNVSRVTVP